MAKIRGPHGSDPAKAGGQVLPLRPVPRTQPTENTEQTSQERERSAVFDPTQSKDLSLPDANARPRGAGVQARLAALGVRRAGELPVKGREVVRVRETPIGKIVEGSLVIESAAGLQKLEDVVRLTGDLTVQETKLAGGEVTPVRSLLEIGGRLTIEGITS